MRWKVLEHDDIMVLQGVTTTVIQGSILNGENFRKFSPRKFSPKFSSKFSSWLLTMTQLVRIMISDCYGHQALEHLLFVSHSLWRWDFRSFYRNSPRNYPKLSPKFSPETGFKALNQSWYHLGPYRCMMSHRNGLTSSKSTFRWVYL